MTCPQSVFAILDLDTFTACIITYQLGKTDAEVKAYFDSGGDRQCLATKGGCDKIQPYLGCQLTTAQVIKDMTNYQGDANANCQALFIHDKSEYCAMQFGTLLNYYCVPQPVLSSGQLAGIIVGGIAFVVFLLYICYRVKISHDLEREIEAAVGGLPPGAVLKPPPGLGPPSPNNLLGMQSDVGSPQMQHAPVNAIKYLGVRPNPNAQANTFDAFCFIASLGREEWLGTFATQEEAARVYDAKVWQLRQSGLSHAPMNWEPEHTGRAPRFVGQPQQQQQQQVRSPGGHGQVKNSPHVGGGYPQQRQQQQHHGAPAAAAGGRVKTFGFIQPIPDDPNATARRKEELIFFYRYYDETKPNIEATVDGLFAKYTFLGIARAVRNKYGILPKGWEEECNRLRSHNFSERISRMMFGGGGGSVAGSSSRMNRMPAGTTMQPTHDVVPDF